MCAEAIGEPAQSRLGSPRVHAREIDSTNDHARELALAGAPHGTLVTAGVQTAGRGRQGRSWSAPRGGALLMSLLLRDGGGADRGRDAGPAAPMLAAAVAVCDVIGEGAMIKWPNDIVLVRAGGLAKLAGILAEGRPEKGWTVLGIGLNVSLRLDQLEPELRDRAATLGRPSSAIEPLLEELLDALQWRLSAPATQTLARWRELDALAGREISWADGRGLARGIDEQGNLIVELGDGERAVLDAGEVHVGAGPA